MRTPYRTATEMKAKDLAKKLGVSPATISLVLNNKPGISDSLRKSLLERIQELGHEEMICQSCRDGAAPGSVPAETPAEREGCSCKSIAYLIYHNQDYADDMKDPYNFFTGVLEGIEYEAWENDCCLVMVHMNRHKGRSLAGQLRRMGNVVGVIVHPCGLDERVERDMKSLDVPYVFMDAYSSLEWQPSTVCISNWQGMETTVRYLKSMGHQELGYVYSGWETGVERDRRRCFRQAMEAYGISVQEEFFFCSGTGHDLFEFQRLAEAFSQAECLPTALVCENDRQAWRTIKALQSIGRRVPEDVSVIGFDDQALCTMITPSITSIHNSPHLMGRECVLMLQNLIRLREREPDPWLRYELPARLVVRESVRDLTQNI